MDGRRFDAIIRAVHGGTNRRQAIVAALGVALGGGVGVSLARGSRPGGEGPCVSTKRPDNICTRDAECCTNVCNLATGTRNRDGKGRCRCIGPREACREDRNCCQRGWRPFACIGGFCQPAAGPTATPAPQPTSTPMPCGAISCASGCCNNGSCVPFASQSEDGCGAGGAACAGCLSGQACVTGACVCNAASCPSGCCDMGIVCLPGNNPTYCGAGGAACQLCAASHSCISGACVI